MIPQDRQPARSQKALSRITFGQFFRDWYVPYAEVRKKTLFQEEYTFRKHLADSLGKVRLVDLTSNRLDDWLTEHIRTGLKPSTINKHIAFVNRLIRLAEKWSLIDSKSYFALRIDKLKTGDYTQRFLQKDEVESLIAAARRDTHPFILEVTKILLLTGCRVGELRQARWRDLDDKARIWRVPVAKGGRSRRIYLNAAAMNTFREIFLKANHLGLKTKPDNFIVANPKTGDCYDSFYASWYRVLDDAGLSGVRLHDLRHTYASVLINNGATIYEVQKLLGHSSVNMTQRYAQLFPDTLHEKAEMAASFLRA